MNLNSYLSEKCRMIDPALDLYLPPDNRYPDVIYKAVRYSVLDGGKRLRPVLCLAACEAVGGQAESALPTACAIEFIHAFSLIHDDLPALDNDDYRRGKPTNHKVFGEAMAVLAGDLLIALAFETITGRTRDVPAATVLEVARRVASATGAGGMVVGQVADMISEGKRVDMDTLDFIHKNKTGALIEASVVSGGMLGGGAPEQIKALSVFGQKIGLAFQITDDILDIVGDQKQLGKPVGSDLRNEKTTYPSLYGLDKSKKLAFQAANEAVGALSIFDFSANPLRLIAKFVVERKA